MRILIVEDREIIALAMIDAVREMGGIAIGPAATLQEALDRARNEVCDAALIDIWLGDTAAFAVGEALAKRGIPFVVISGAVSPDQPLIYQRAPRLFKPFSSEEIRDALLSVLPRPIAV